MSFDHHHGHKKNANIVGRYKVEGIMAGVATTPSTQGAGVAGAIAIRVDETVGYVKLPRMVVQADAPGSDPRFQPDDDGVVADRAATADVSLVAENGWVDNGFERRVARVAYVLPGGSTVNYANVSGTQAASAGAGNSSSVTDAEIDAALGSFASPAGQITWMKLYEVTIFRSADAVIQETRSNTVRPIGVHRTPIQTSAL